MILNRLRVEGSRFLLVLDPRFSREIPPLTPFGPRGIEGRRDDRYTGCHQAARPPPAYRNLHAPPTE